MIHIGNTRLAFVASKSVVQIKAAAVAWSAYFHPASSVVTVEPCPVRVDGNQPADVGA